MDGRVRGEPSSAWSPNPRFSPEGPGSLLSSLPALLWQGLAGAGCYGPAKMLTDVCVEALSFPSPHTISSTSQLLCKVGRSHPHSPTSRGPDRCSVSSKMTQLVSGRARPRTWVSPQNHTMSFFLFFFFFFFAF